MARSAGSIIGLDIGSSFIKVVEVTSRGGQPEVTAVGIMPTPPDSVIQGLVIDPPALGLTLRHLLEVSNIRTRRVASSVAGANNVTVRIIEVPRMSDKDLAETMRYEIDRFVPFAHGQQIERAYQPLPIPSSNEANMQVMLAVAVQDVINAHLVAIQSAGLESVAIEVEPLAVARSLTGLADRGHPLQETVGILNMGASNTELSVVTGGMLVFPRTISIGGDSFTKALAENFGMRADAAERLKRQYAAIDLDRISFGASADGGDFGGGMPDFTSPDSDFAPPPSFDAAGAAAPAGTAAATPGLNPFLYGQKPPGGAGAAGAGASSFDLPGFAPPGEDEPIGGKSIFDLGESGGDSLSEMFPGQAQKAAPSVSSFDSGFTPASPFGGDEEPAIGASPFGGGDADLLGGFDLGGPSTAGGSGQPEDEEAQTARQVQDIIMPVLGELVTELRRSLEYYRSHNPGLPISRLLLCGGTSRMPNLDRYLEQELGVAVSIADPVGYTHSSVTTASPNWLHEISPMLGVAIGLAERDLVEIPRNYVPQTITVAAAAA